MALIPSRGPACWPALRIPVAGSGAACIWELVGGGLACVPSAYPTVLAFKALRAPRVLGALRAPAAALSAALRRGGPGSRRQSRLCHPQEFTMTASLDLTAQQRRIVDALRPILGAEAEALYEAHGRSLHKAGRLRPRLGDGQLPAPGDQPGAGAGAAGRGDDRRTGVRLAGGGERFPEAALCRAAAREL